MTCKKCTRLEYREGGHQYCRGQGFILSDELFERGCDYFDPIKPQIKKARHWVQSCDFCDSQEMEHFCLYWSLPMKNMDLKTCGHWTPKRRSCEKTPKKPGQVMDKCP